MSFPSGGMSTMVPPHLFALLLLLLSLPSTRPYDAVPLMDDWGCELHPPDITEKNDHTPGDNGFGIVLSGNPKKFVPGAYYTVTLKTWMPPAVVRKFIAFSLSLEPTVPGKEGTFEIIDERKTRFAPGCSYIVTQTSITHRDEISVRWKAPPAKSNCVRFKALIVEQKNLWYVNDGNLTKELCEEEFEERDLLEEGCHACDEAKYEVIFESLWSRHTHPNHFPSADAGFADVIGASHSGLYTMWEYGVKATEGLHNLANDGNTTVLESELVNNARRIRTVIKARGLKHPNTKTFAVFRVDQEHHLLSLVSKILPSPDWIIGVSNLELCRPDNTWKEQVKLRLFPWDAGIDSAITYKEKHPLPRREYEKIRRITSSFPNDDRSPFFDETGNEMEPLAQIIITRKRLYEMPCRDSIPPDEDDMRPECETTGWSEFSSCSASCGRGYRIRRRYYTIGASAVICNKILSQKEICETVCDESNGPYDFPRQPRCAVLPWSSWSECSESCGKGTRHRTRSYKDKSIERYCTLNTRDTEICHSNGPSCLDVLQPCSVTEWSKWSPCSVTCGTGTIFRTRTYVKAEDESDPRCNVIKMERDSCTARKLNCVIDPADAREICLTERSLGPCRGYFPRWYFDATKKMCLQFIYGGCRGNQNNFERYEDCFNMCRMLTDNDQSHQRHQTPTW